MRCFQSAYAHSPRTVHEPQASYKHPCLGVTETEMEKEVSASTAWPSTSTCRRQHQRDLQPLALWSQGPMTSPTPAWPEFQMSDARRRGPMRSEAEHKQDQKLFFCSRSLAHWWWTEEESGETDVVGTPGPKCSQAYMLGPIKKNTVKWWLCCVAGGILFP